MVVVVVVRSGTSGLNGRCVLVLQEIAKLLSKVAAPFIQAKCESSTCPFSLPVFGITSVQIVAFLVG